MSGKTYLFVLCGVGDRPVRQLGNKTPLEAAKTVHLDALAQHGVQGLLTVINDEICPETDSGTMALLGYEPLDHYTGRGALEALGLGFMELGENAVGFRVNFASFDESRQVLDRRTARDLSEAEQQQLVDEIRANVRMDQTPGIHYSIWGFGRHRGIVCLKSLDVPLSANVSNTDPGFRMVGPFGVPNQSFEPRPRTCEPLDRTAGAVNTARCVNQFAAEAAAVMGASRINADRKARGSLPANILLFRDAGAQPPKLESFAKRHGGSLSLHGQVPAENGLCKLIGGAYTDCRMLPGQAEDEYYRKLAQSVLSDPADCVVVHIKAPDEPGHDGKPEEKMRAIERFDDLFVGPFKAGLRDDDVCIMTSDHSTPCELQIHSADRVPTLVYSRRLPADETRKFCEREAAHGGLGVGRAAGLLSYLKHALKDR